MAHIGDNELKMSVFLYDAHCSNCSRLARLLDRLSGRHLQVAPLQEFESADPRLSAQELLREAKLVRADGAIYGGAEAIVRAVGGPALIYYTPGIRQLADRLYSRVAARRCRL